MSIEFYTTSENSIYVLWIVYANIWTSTIPLVDRWRMMEPFRSQVKAPVRCASPEPEATAGSWEKGRNKSWILKCSIDIHMYHIFMCICTGTCRCITGITHLYISCSCTWCKSTCAGDLWPAPFQRGNHGGHGGGPGEAPWLGQKETGALNIFQSHQLLGDMYGYS